MIVRSNNFIINKETKNMRFESVSVNDNQWNTYVTGAYLYDFHHTSVYHQIETVKGQVAKLFVAQAGDEYLCLPLIIRSIPNTHFYDATSVYGYAGPIASKPLADISEKLVDYFKTKLTDYLKENNIVSVFTRLHPFIEQTRVINGLGKVVDLNKTVAIDLTLPPDIQRQGYSRSYKNQINQLKKKKGYTVSTVNSDSFDTFKSIYFETMDRVGAKEHYYFSDQYLKTLIDNDSFKTIVLFAKNANDEVVSAALFTVTNSIMQYHLGGTKNSALVDAPIKYVMDEARLLANELGLTHFHLGGGLGVSEDDPLLKFKKGFSKTLFQFKVWNWIVEPEKYATLVSNAGLDTQVNQSFFPLYRLNL